ncbi:nucleotide pyrophosphohydrolase [Spartinivicinus poritis]|uniref:Nucleotide pyrophosphohydrolase n=1 Tax=Spartinivicinus poritis TaxID=2994640 RepID=A0ABT5UFW3_9GAMM|nr:nucleotide pyrophosphohydrolase [Spartinivicinus sp. A2-2]MDE1465273.1 nucleotide pyrophosphohydrolase [Spartinivicinus sp. A2-2]
MESLESLKVKLSEFVNEREWEKFHSPKNLAMALSAEAGELLEIFQWLTEEQSKNLNPEQLSAAADELADIQIYLIMLFDQLGLDPIKESHRKLECNKAKYPVSKAKGNSQKYTNL